MRVFQTECKDSKTGLSMVLSEVSYNFACDWLALNVEKYGAEIYRTEKHIKDNSKLSDMMCLWVGIPHEGINPMTGREDMWYIESRKFYYDEERGYLLGE